MLVGDSAVVSEFGAVWLLGQYFVYFGYCRLFFVSFSCSCVFLTLAPILNFFRVMSLFI